MQCITTAENWLQPETGARRASAAGDAPRRLRQSWEVTATRAGALIAMNDRIRQDAIARGSQAILTAHTYSYEHSGQVASSFGLKGLLGLGKRL
jgi:hypothetical protein